MWRDRISKTSEFLFGDPRTTLFEQRLVNIVFFTSTIMFLMASFVNINLSLMLVLSTLGFCLLACGGYYLSRFRRRYTLALVALFAISLATIVYIWILNAGSLGAIPYFFTAILTVVALTLEGHFRAIALTLLVLSALSLYSLEHWELIYIRQYPSPEARYYDNMFNMIVSALFTVIVIVLFKLEFNKERMRAENLLLNILPKSIVNELKFNQGSIAANHKEVSVLFADIVNFTDISSLLSPEQVVDMLNSTFTSFDQLADKHGLEKIKTIGDAYMIAGNLTNPCADHVHRVADFAIEMLSAAQSTQIPDSDEVLRLRVGIHLGPVTAGVIGTRKFLYDIWGDTVNIASRMESNGEPGKIQVTSSVLQKLWNDFTFLSGRTTPIKGKGEMCTYYLVGRTC